MFVQVEGETNDEPTTTTTNAPTETLWIDMEVNQSSRKVPLDLSEPFVKRAPDDASEPPNLSSTNISE